MEHINFTLNDLKKDDLEDFSSHLKYFDYQDLSRLYRDYRNRMSKMTLMESEDMQKFYILEGYLSSKFFSNYNKDLDYFDNTRKK